MIKIYLEACCNLVFNKKYTLFCVSIIRVNTAEFTFSVPTEKIIENFNCIFAEFTYLSNHIFYLHSLFKCDKMRILNISSTLKWPRYPYHNYDFFIKILFLLIILKTKYYSKSLWKARWNKVIHFTDGIKEQKIFLPIFNSECSALLLNHLTFLLFSPSLKYKQYFILVHCIRYLKIQMTNKVSSFNPEDFKEAK